VVDATSCCLAMDDFERKSNDVEIIYSLQHMCFVIVATDMHYLLLKCKKIVSEE
jgi:hypothetical protein